MDTKAFERLKADLEAQGAADLAAFIVERAEADDVLMEAASLFVQRSDSKALVKSLRNKIAGLKRGTRFYRYRETGMMVEKLDEILDPVERDLLQAAPGEAIEVLGRFLETDEVVFNRADDSSGSLGICYGRAADLMGQACEAAGRPEKAEKWFRRLAERSGYGIEDYVCREAGRMLSDDARQRLVAEWRERMDVSKFKDEFAFRGFRLSFAAFARAIGEPELFAEVLLHSEDARVRERFAVDVAEVYFECGRFEEAKAWLPVVAGGIQEWKAKKLRLEIYDALGDHEGVERELLERFKADPSGLAAEAYLERLPEERRVVEREGLRKLVDEGSYEPQVKAAFYLDWGDAVAAAALIEAYADGFMELSYYTQKDMAKPLEQTQPLSASILYRGAAEQTLAEARSKTYPYAARYVKKLGALAERIDDWGSVPDHASWWAELKAKHGRKTAFQAAVKKAGVEW